MNYVATRLAAVKPSASMAASMAAKALRATGVDVIDLGLGEPDFPLVFLLVAVTVVSTTSSRRPRRCVVNRMPHIAATCSPMRGCIRPSSQ